MAKEIKTSEEIDDWGNCQAIFTKSYANGKLNLGKQPALKTHRGGWLKVLEAMQPLNNSEGVYCETFVESLFDWFRAKNERDKNIPITEPWVGFIHNPHNMPKWYKPAWDGKGDKLFEESLKSCEGIYSMSQYHADGLSALYPNTKFESILHPYPNEITPTWTGRMDRLVSVGWWLRRQTSIYRVDVPINWTRVKLWPYPEGSKPVEYVNDRLKLEHKYLQYTLSEIEHRYHLSNEEYDDFICDSVVLLDLWDTSANNTILECIQREVPIVVKDPPAVREYLGDDYPLYFQDLHEVYYLLDASRLVQASNYLKAIKESNKFTLNTFVTNLTNSNIYGSLQV